MDQLEERTCALLLAYEGTPFRGWQRQAGVPTVQQAVEDALEGCLGRRSQISGASRTDAGVHAEGQVAHFQARLPIDLPGLLDGLSQNFPPALAVRAVAEASPSFHARSSAVGKRYRYRFCWGEHRPARSFWLGPDAAPDWQAARSALEGLAGLAHLSGLASPARGGKLAPPLDAWSLHETGAKYEVALEVAGAAFRKHQIRNLAGHLAAIALGLAQPESLRALAGMRRPWRGATAPGHGLTLLEVRYPPELDPFRERPGGQTPAAAGDEKRAISSAAISR